MHSKTISPHKSIAKIKVTGTWKNNRRWIKFSEAASILKSYTLTKADPGYEEKIASYLLHDQNQSTIPSFLFSFTKW